MAKIIRMEGQTFGGLTVLRKAGTKRKYATWQCRCSCGEEVIVRGDLLRRGVRSVCSFEKHKLIFPRPRSRDALTWSSWKRMHYRCNAKQGKHHKNYGLRGIKVHPAWESFDNFVADVGPRLHEVFTIERVDNDRGYEPGNCRWATNDEQQWNKRNTRSPQEVDLLNTPYEQVKRALAGGETLAEAVAPFIGEATWSRKAPPLPELRAEFLARFHRVFAGDLLRAAEYISGTDWHRLMDALTGKHKLSSKPMERMSVKMDEAEAASSNFSIDTMSNPG